MVICSVDFERTLDAAARCWGFPSFAFLDCSGLDELLKVVESMID